MKDPSPGNILQQENWLLLQQPPVSTYKLVLVQVIPAEQFSDFQLKLSYLLNNTQKASVPRRERAGEVTTGYSLPVLCA